MEAYSPPIFSRKARGGGDRAADTLPDGWQPGASNSARGTCPPAPFHGTGLSLKRATQPPQGCIQQADPPDRQVAGPLEQAFPGRRQGPGLPLRSKGAVTLHQEWLGLGTSCTRPYSHAEVPQRDTGCCHTQTSPRWGENGHPVCKPAQAVGQCWDHDGRGRGEPSAASPVGPEARQSVL